MSKSVLVIDTPGSCMGCNFFICDGDTNMDSCMARETAKSVDLEKYDKPDWCPLRPLPEKSTTENDMTDYQCGMVDGRNQRIDEIVGEVKYMSKKVKCCECASFLGLALPGRVDKDNYEYAKRVFKLASTTGVCIYSMKTKQMAHEQYCKRFEKNKYLEQESESFKQEILNLKNAISEYEKENFVEVDESWKILFMKRFQEVK